MTIGVVAAWALLLRPQSLGGPGSYVMVSGDSMQPTLDDGDFAVARAQRSYEVGDVVVFRVPEDEVGGGSLIIHRLVGGSASEGFVMQGDNRETPDLWRPTPAQIEAKLWFFIPDLARWLLLLRSPLVLATIAGVSAFLFIFMKGRDEPARDVDDAIVETEHPLRRDPEIAAPSAAVDPPPPLRRRRFVKIGVIVVILVAGIVVLRVVSRACSRVSRYAARRRPAPLCMPTAT